MPSLLRERSGFVLAALLSMLAPASRGAQALRGLQGLATDSTRELFGSYRRGAVEFSLTPDNRFNTVWNEAQFATTSRLRNESHEVTELNYTPGAPRSVQLGVAYRF